MYVLFQQLVRELQRNAAVQPYTIDPEQVIARIEMLPSGYRPESGPLPRDTLYLCEHWQFKHFDPRAELPPIVCVVEANADTNANAGCNAGCDSVLPHAHPDLRLGEHLAAERHDVRDFRKSEKTGGYRNQSIRKFRSRNPVHDALPELWLAALVCER